jgi:hypothetical protein
MHFAVSWAFFLGFFSFFPALASQTLNAQHRVTIQKPPFIELRRITTAVDN